jgi:hypothetical protein
LILRRQPQNCHFPHRSFQQTTQNKQDNGVRKLAHQRQPAC